MAIHLGEPGLGGAMGHALNFWHLAEQAWPQALQLLKCMLLRQVQDGVIRGLASEKTMVDTLWKFKSLRH
jgi:hypothetical protein